MSQDSTLGSDVFPGGINEGRRWSEGLMRTRRCDCPVGRRRAADRRRSVIEFAQLLAMLIASIAATWFLVWLDVAETSVVTSLASIVVMLGLVVWMTSSVRKSVRAPWANLNLSDTWGIPLSAVGAGWGFSSFFGSFFGGIGQAVCVVVAMLFVGWIGYACILRVPPLATRFRENVLDTPTTPATLRRYRENVLHRLQCQGHDEAEVWKRFRKDARKRARFRQEGTLALRTRRLLLFTVASYEDTPLVLTTYASVAGLIPNFMQDLPPGPVTTFFLLSPFLAIPVVRACWLWIASRGWLARIS